MQDEKQQNIVRDLFEYRFDLQMTCQKQVCTYISLRGDEHFEHPTSIHMCNWFFLSRSSTLSTFNSGCSDFYCEL